MLRVTVIDDDPLQAEIMRRLFRTHDDLETTIYEQAEEAIDALRSTKRERLPHLILLDLRMPGLDGHAVQRVLAGDDHLRPIPVDVLSGSTLESDSARSYELGAAAYLPKPDALGELRELLGDLIGLWRRVLPPPGGAPAPSIVA